MALTQELLIIHPSKGLVFWLLMERNNAHTITLAVASAEATTPSCALAPKPAPLHWYPLRVYYPGPHRKASLRQLERLTGIGMGVIYRMS